MRKLLLVTGLLIFITETKAQVPDAEKKLALELLQKNSGATGLSATDLANSLVGNTYQVPGSGIRMVYLQQRFQNIPVYNQLNVLAFQEEKLVSNTGSRLAAPEQRTGNASPVPEITAEMAVRAALEECKVSTAKAILPGQLSPDGSKFNYGNLDVASENITAELIWFPIDEGNELKLAWQVFLAPRNSSDYWLIRVDAATRQVISKESLTVYCNWDKKGHSPEEHIEQHFDASSTPANVFNGPETKQSPADQAWIVNNAAYRVIPYPAESPIHPGGGHSLLTNPWTIAPGNPTSLGWHYDGTTYYSSSRGNNVYAYEDRNADNIAGLSAVSTTGQPDLSFDFTPDYGLEPTVTSPAPNQAFNITNLFYWNNMIHDLAYIYGFTETARNFQNSNEGRGGLGADYVLAEAQDGSGTNNANFATPPDGSRPRMQMFLWTAPTPDRDGDVDNGIIIHEYTHGISNRMTGTGNGCLSNAEQMGEGWSDYFALMMTHDWSAALPGDGFSKPRGIGTYALNQPVTGAGIRQYRYTTDMSVNPLTYANLPTVAHPHGTGTIWCTVLWDMTWEIIQMAGINPSLHNIGANGGNAIALKLVTEGLRLQPCSPGFIDGRNAILKADTLFFGAQYSCAIINAFARRGMGIGALQGSSNSRTDQSVSYTGCTPGACNAPTGLVSSAITSSSATISWGAAGAAVSYDVDYKENASAVWINAATGVTTTSVNLSGLAVSTLYDWRVRTNCSSSSSGYAQAQFTTTAIVCNAPTGLAATAVTTNSATLNWSAVSGGVSYDVDYKANSASNWTNVATATSSTSVNLGGLSASTLYDFRVRTNCATGNSGYTQAQFTTASLPSSCPGIYDISTNGTSAGAALIPLNTDVKGLINPVGDNDYYQFQVSTGGSITISLTTLPANYDLRLYNATGTKLAESKKTGTSSETISRTVTAGTYYAMVVPKNSATHPTSCYTLRVATGTASFGEEELIVQDGIRVFPNPVKDKFMVSIPELRGAADIRVFDMYGKLLLQKNSNQATTTVDLTVLSPGFYLVKISNNGKESSLKIVKE